MDTLLPANVHGSFKKSRLHASNYNFMCVTSVRYRWRSASWCRTGRAFLAPESRFFCQFRLVCPKTWSETPEPGGTGHKAGPEKSEEQMQSIKLLLLSGDVWETQQIRVKKLPQVNITSVKWLKNSKIVLTYFCLTIFLQFSAPSTLMWKTLLKSSKPADF